MKDTRLPDRIPELVGQVYDCVTDVALWPETLERMTASFGGVVGLLAVSDTVAGRSRFSLACGDPAIVAPLVDAGASGLPFYPALSRIEVDEPVTIDMLYDVQGPGARQDWLDSDLNRNWAQPNRLDDFFWVALMKKPSRIGNFVVITTRDHPQIRPDELAAFAALAPHVRRAVTIGDLFEMERQTTALFRTIVDVISVPVAIVTADLRLLYANPEAERLLSDGTAVGLGNGRLRFGYALAGTAIADAIARGCADEFALGPSGIDVPLARAARPAVAHVLPLARRDVSARVRAEAAAAIFIAEAGHAPLPALAALAALFGLTPAERRVAGQVAEGMTRHEIALAGAVSDGTVKSQLAAIFEKTGAGDQRGLAALLRELTPPVRRAPGIPRAADESTPDDG